MDFPLVQKSKQSRIFPTMTDVKGKVEGNSYSSADMLFPFEAALLDRTTGYSNKPKLETGFTMYLDSVKYFILK